MDFVCNTCKGFREVLCRRCMGEGTAKFNALTNMTCPLCKGCGQMECVDCPPLGRSANPIYDRSKLFDR